MKIERKNKKGISPVIATILLILITVAAVGILAAFIYPMVQQNTQTATLCFDAQSQIQIETQNGRTCFRYGSGGSLSESNVSVQISKIPGKGGVELMDVQIILTKDNGNTFSKRVVTELTQTVPNDNEAKTYVIDSEAALITKVAIAPIVKTGNTEKTCPIGQPIDVPACA